jgi:hypothetical protein
MNKYSKLLLFLALALTGCNQGAERSYPAKTLAGGSQDTSQYFLASEPAGAKSVIAVRKQAKDGDATVVVGRVGGSQKPMVEGRAAFTIVDTSLLTCKQTEGDACATPWDYCCEPKDNLARATVMVKFVNAEGKTIAEGADSLLGIKPLETLVVQGVAKRDTDGNLTILASKLYRKPLAEPQP